MFAAAPAIVDNASQLEYANAAFGETWNKPWMSEPETLMESPSPGVGRSRKSPARVAVVLGALGVVFGDIGTSPLYALRETIRATGGPTREAVLGSVSLILWSLVLSTTLVYINAILRVTNRGEGGILSLAALLRLHRLDEEGSNRRRVILLVVAILGAAMIFGDAIITPAISVLSAIEGLRTAVPRIEHWVLPIALGVLIGFFILQVAGTERIGSVFGPIMLGWFVVMGGLGAGALLHEPAILAALDPRHAIHALSNAPAGPLVVLAAVFLALTGAEALYADLGQFGRRAIATGWYLVVLPGVALNYLGQGATILGDPGAADAPFFALVPPAAALPLVVLATCATVIASQAVVTGLFTVVQQAGRLRLLPPIGIRHTSHENEHHVYVGIVNVTVGVLALAVAWGFGSSDALSDAYGLAVSVAMVSTSILFVAALRTIFHWRWRTLAPLAAFILTLDLTFLTANLSKIETGGWLPALLAAAAFTIMIAWTVGIRRARPSESDMPLSMVLDQPGLAPLRGGRRPVVALCQPDRQCPTTLLKLHRLLNVAIRPLIIVTVRTRAIPHVDLADRALVSMPADGVFQIEVLSGFMQNTDLPSILGPILKAHGMRADQATYIVGHDRVRLPRTRSWRTIAMRPLGWLFVFMTRNAQRAVDRFNLPAHRTIEIGTVHEF